MISQDLVKLIIEHADELTNRCLKDIYSREETRSFKDVPRAIMFDRVRDHYSKLDAWLAKGTKEGIHNYYIKLGQTRFHEGIPLHELIMAFMLIKRHLWLFVQEKQFYDSAYALNQAIELNNRVVLFFDRIIYAITIGYENEIHAQVAAADSGLFGRIFKRRTAASLPV